jgi:hypothetical protein
MQVKRKGDPKPKASAVSNEAKRQVEVVRGMLMDKVPNANPSEDFLAQVASTYFLSNKNKSIIDAAVKKLQG